MCNESTQLSHLSKYQTLQPKPHSNTKFYFVTKNIYNKQHNISTNELILNVVKIRAIVSIMFHVILLYPIYNTHNTNLQPTKTKKNYKRIMYNINIHHLWFLCIKKFFSSQAHSLLRPDCQNTSKKHRSITK